jgi:quercetin dioxygenase-like cupin family protein
MTATECSLTHCGRAPSLPARVVVKRSLAPGTRDGGISSASMTAGDRYVHLTQDGGGEPTCVVRPVDWTVMPEVAGVALDGVEEVAFEPWEHGRAHFVRIPAGASMPMHGNVEHVCCVVVQGAGRLTLPSGDGVDYSAPEVMVFDPGVPHAWVAVTADTVLAVCLVEP